MISKEIKLLVVFIFILFILVTCVPTNSLWHGIGFGFFCGWSISQIVLILLAFIDRRDAKKRGVKS